MVHLNRVQGARVLLLAPQRRYGALLYIPRARTNPAVSRGPGRKTELSQIMFAWARSADIDRGRDERGGRIAIFQPAVSSAAK